MSLAMIRPAHIRDLPALSTLCQRSKAVWGYDAAFMAACVEELTLHAGELQETEIGVLEADGVPVGVVQVSSKGAIADLERLFIAPEAMGRGHGRDLLAWAVERAQDKGATHMTIESDPGAEPFYLKHGARRVGQVASGSIAGRMLPLLEMPVPAPLSVPAQGLSA